MELIYSVDCRGVTINRDWSFGEETVNSLSCRNILAFIVTNNAESSNGPQRHFDQFEVCYEVKVIDLDRPWEDYHVLFSNLPIRHLQWDRSGLKLLVVDVMGIFHIWMMEDHLINQWQKIGTAGVKGDEILTVAWLQDNDQTLFNPEKRDSILYTDKFQRRPALSSPSLLGSKAKDGWVAVTASGMVSIGVMVENPSGDERPLITVRKTLASSYQQITRADISFTVDGQVMLVTNDGLVSSAIQCYLLTVTIQPTTVSVAVQSTSSFHFKGQMEFGAKDSQTLRVTQVQFLNEATSDVVLVVCSSHGYSCMEVWQLLETTVPLHRMFQSQGKSDPNNKVRRWVHKSSTCHSSQLASVAGPHLPMTRSHYDVPGFLSYIALSYRDGSIKILHRQSYVVMWTSGADGVLGHHSPSPRSEKRRRVTHYLSSLRQTASGCGLVGQCAGHIYLLRVFNARESQLQITPPMIVMLFEYFLMIGHDFWDVLLAVRQGMIESINTKLTDNFNKQPHAMQEILRIRLVRLKMALYMSLGVGQNKAADMRASLTLNAISSLFKSILRPKAIGPQDKGPAEKLSLVVMKQVDMDLNGTLASLEADEFIFEAIHREKSGQTENSLSALQPILQWVADFAVHLLSSLPQCQSYSNFPGFSLLRDLTVLMQLRELLIVSRIWGLVNPNCLPFFNANATYHDCLAHLYKLLTKMWLNLKEGTAPESDDSLIDECINLSSMVHAPNVKQSFGEENASFSILWLTLPQTFTLGEEPDYLYSLMNSRRIYTAEGLFYPEQHYDVVRHIHLGAKQSEDVRECCRCTARSLLRSTARTPLMQSWEQRFYKTCLCGGHWKLRKVQ